MLSGGGSDNVDKDFFFLIYGLFKGTFDILKSYLVVFGLFLTKTEAKI